MLSLRVIRRVFILNLIPNRNNSISSTASIIYTYTTSPEYHLSLTVYHQRRMASSDPTSNTDTQTPHMETNTTDGPEVTAPGADVGTAESNSEQTVDKIKTNTETASREDRDATPPLESPEDATEKPAEKSSDSEPALHNQTETSDERVEKSQIKSDKKAAVSPDAKAPNKPWYMRSNTTPVMTREHFENMPIDRKRKLYKCGSRYQQLKDIDTWPVFRAAHKCSSKYKLPQLLEPDAAINSKLSLWRGDITTLEIDAIVNAANHTLLGGGGVDGAIHDAAGRSLHNECSALNGCETGESKLSGGHRLPAKYIIHTVGPIGEHEGQLASCYQSCLRLVEVNSIKSIAFCCISTGIYGYPNLRAAKTALQIVRNWFETSEYAKTHMERVIFCVFLKIDFQIYSELMCNFFPTPAPPISDTNEIGDKESTPPAEDKEPVVPQPPAAVPPLETAVTAPAAIISQLAPAEGDGNKAREEITECSEATHGMSEGGATVSELERVEPSAKLPKLEEAATHSDAESESAKKDKPTECMEDRDTQDPTTDAKPAAEEEKSV